MSIEHRYVAGPDMTLEQHQAMVQFLDAFELIGRNVTRIVIEPDRHGAPLVAIETDDDRSP